MIPILLATLLVLTLAVTIPATLAWALVHGAALIERRDRELSNPDKAGQK